jgi:hypothetical protein
MCTHFRLVKLILLIENNSKHFLLDVTVPQCYRIVDISLNVTLNNSFQR